jgi:alkaline phosphatase
MVTSPHNEGTDVDVNLQTVKNPGGAVRGGYSVARAGAYPWSIPTDAQYPIAKPDDAPLRHAYTDSSSSAQSMTTGTKTYNNAVNVDFMGRQVPTIAHIAQAEGYSVGAVTSVPISHATPAATYAHNVHRDDYKDLTRDLVGLKSVAHPEHPLPGLDVLIGAGWGVTADKNDDQGLDFVPGNIYLTEADRAAIDVNNGGHYVVTTRADGQNGRQALLEASQKAAAEGQRLFGFFGTTKGHLPFATADGDFTPAPGKSEAEVYTPEDLAENPTLVEPETSTGPTTTTTSTIPSGPSSAATRPSRRSPTGSRSTATGRSPS